MTIKNLVLSGGSWKGLYMCGAIRKLLEQEYIKVSDVETIWATSVGTIVSVIFALKINWNDIVEYFINVPLKSFDNLKLEDYLRSIKNCGLLDKEFFITLLNTLFNTKNLNLN